jgi:hypothetical protein
VLSPAPSGEAETGDVATAVDEFEKLLADYIRVMGPNHRDTLATRRDLSLWHSVAAHREELPQAGRLTSDNGVGGRRCDTSVHPN